MLCCSVITHEASVGGSASISCKYIRNQNQGFFCRGDQPDICVRDGVRVSSKNSINGRFSLTDETSAGVFTVNISNLTAEDSGKYWCAEENSGSFILTEVQLHVKGEMTTSDTKRKMSQDKENPEMTTSDTKTETSQDKEKPGFSAIVVVSVGLILLALVIVFILFKLKLNKHVLSFTISALCAFSEMTASDTKTETSQDKEKPGFSVIVVVSVGLILLALVIVLILFKLRRNKHGFSVTAVVSVGLVLFGVCLTLVVFKIKYNSKHDANSSDRRETEDHETAQEEIQDSDPESNPLYSTVQLPTNPSDELLYAAVSFQKNEESLSDATVRFSKDEIHCDYASVNHRINH
ncbi:polymeric immunoglobulin receptor-like protein [Labeo rohita]|nr:polymeric immunoglobulin receptor-like protein [Labeo rohita]